MINYRVLYRTRFFFCKKMVREYVRYVYNDKNMHKKYINIQKNIRGKKCLLAGRQMSKKMKKRTKNILN